MALLALVLLGALPCAARFGDGFTAEALDGGMLVVTSMGSSGGSDNVTEWAVLHVDPADCSYRGVRFESVTGSAFGSLQVMSSAGAEGSAVLREFGFVSPRAGHPADAIALSTRTAQRGPAVTQRASAIAVSSEGLTCHAPLGGTCGDAFRTLRGERFARQRGEHRAGGLVMSTWADEAALPQRHQLMLVEQPSRNRHLWVNEVGLPLRVAGNSLWLLVRGDDAYPLPVVSIDLTSGQQTPLEVPGPKGHRCSLPRQLKQAVASGLLVLDEDSDVPRLVRWNELRPPSCHNVSRE